MPCCRNQNRPLSCCVTPCCLTVAWKPGPKKVRATDRWFFWRQFNHQSDLLHFETVRETSKTFATRELEYISTCFASKYVSNFTERNQAPGPKPLDGTVVASMATQWGTRYMYLATPFEQFIICICEINIDMCLCFIWAWYITAHITHSGRAPAHSWSNMAVITVHMRFSSASNMCRANLCASLRSHNALHISGEPSNFSRICNAFCSCTPTIGTIGTHTSRTAAWRLGV